MFYIGQHIVCIKTTKCGRIKEGEVYTIKALRKVCCIIEIHIGFTSSNNTVMCFCGNVYDNNNIFWFGESLFKPLDELSDISELLEVLNKENYQEV